MLQMLKERGVKSLLQRLRGNVEASGNLAVKPEVIKDSKLMKAGEGSPTKAGGMMSSKVMINPVPVAINRNGSQQGRKDLPSPAKPQGILKTSSKILSRSLTGISAIDFDV